MNFLVSAQSIIFWVIAALLLIHLSLDLIAMPRWGTSLTMIGLLLICAGFCLQLSPAPNPSGQVPPEVSHRRSLGRVGSQPEGPDGAIFLWRGVGNRRPQHQPDNARETFCDDRREHCRAENVTATKFDMAKESAPTWLIRFRRVAPIVVAS